MDFFEGFASRGFYILLFYCKNKTTSLSISLRPLSISPMVSFFLKIMFHFWFSITILGISDVRLKRTSLIRVRFIVNARILISM